MLTKKLIINEKNVTGLIFSGVGFDDVVVEPHVGDSHAVLGEGARLIRADRRRRSQSFDGFQVLDQTVLAGHTFGRKSQTHRHGSQQTFRHCVPNINHNSLKEIKKKNINNNIIHQIVKLINIINKIKL